MRIVGHHQFSPPPHLRNRATQTQIKPHPFRFRSSSPQHPQVIIVSNGQAITEGAGFTQTSPQNRAASVTQASKASCTQHVELLAEQISPRKKEKEKKNDRLIGANLRTPNQVLTHVWVDECSTGVQFTCCRGMQSLPFFVRDGAFRQELRRRPPISVHHHRPLCPDAASSPPCSGPAPLPSQPDTYRLLAFYQNLIFFPQQTEGGGAAEGRSRLARPLNHGIHIPECTRSQRRRRKH